MQNPSRSRSLRSVVAVLTAVLLVLIILNRWVGAVQAETADQPAAITTDTATSRALPSGVADLRAIEAGDRHGR